MSEIKKSKKGGQRKGAGQPKKNLLGYAQIQIPKEIKIKLETLKNYDESWSKFLIRIANL